MNSGWVIDSSVGFAWVHPDQATLKTDNLLQNVGNPVDAVVPRLWFLEMANGLLVLQRRKKITSKERKAALISLASLRLTVDEDEAGRTAFGQTSELAEEHNLTIYDATYLEVALRRKLGLASRDEALIKAAKRCGLKVL